LINQSHRESKSELDEWYDRDFLPLYPPPRRDDQRVEALAELRKLGPRRREEVIAGLKRWAVTWMQHDGGKFAPGPGKFLKGRLFERMPAAALESGSSVGGDSSPYYTGAGDRLKSDQEALERERAAQSPEQRAAECERVRVISMCSKAMHQIEIEFGLSPASRSKVKSLNPAQRDHFADFLDGDDDEETGSIPNISATSAALRRRCGLSIVVSARTDPEVRSAVINVVDTVLQAISMAVRICVESPVTDAGFL
jgi:hypothetical protein